MSNIKDKYTIYDITCIYFKDDLLLTEMIEILNLIKKSKGDLAISNNIKGWFGYGLELSVKGKDFNEKREISIEGGDIYFALGYTTIGLLINFLDKYIKEKGNATFKGFKKGHNIYVGIKIKPLK